VQAYYNVPADIGRRVIVNERHGVIDKNNSHSLLNNRLYNGRSYKVCHTKYDINVDEEGVLLITSGDGDYLLIESREVLDCISSLSSKLFDEYDK